MNSIWNLLVVLVDAEKLGGWVRAAVAAILTQYAGHLMGGVFASPEFVTAASVVMATIVVGAWSSLAKVMASSTSPPPPPPPPPPPRINS